MHAADDRPSAFVSFSIMSSNLGPKAAWVDHMRVSVKSKHVFCLTTCCPVGFATSQNPRISRYYGLSRVDVGCGPLRFALEGRPFDWSRIDSDEHTRQQLALAGWTWAAPGKDGDGNRGGWRSFASGRGGANVEVSDARHAGFCLRASSRWPQVAAG